MQAGCVLALPCMYRLPHYCFFFVEVHENFHGSFHYFHGFRSKYCFHGSSVEVVEASMEVEEASVEVVELP